MFPASEPAGSAYDSAELISAINRYLDAVSYDDRYIFMRHSWYGDSISDIATAMRITPHCVTVCLSSILRRTSCNQRDLQARKSHIDELRRDLAKAESDMQRLREEIVKSLTGDSVFSPELLKTTIDTQEQKCLELGQKLQTAESELSDSEGRIRNISERFDDILEWSGIFHHADMATKKMIVSRLIDRVDIRAGYDVKVTLNISVEQFLNGIEVQK